MFKQNIVICLFIFLYKLNLYMCDMKRSMFTIERILYTHSRLGYKTYHPFCLSSLFNKKLSKLVKATITLWIKINITQVVCFGDVSRRELEKYYCHTYIKCVSMSMRVIVYTFYSDNSYFLCLNIYSKNRPVAKYEKNKNTFKKEATKIDECKTKLFWS